MSPLRDVTPTGRHPVEMLTPMGCHLCRMSPLRDATLMGCHSYGMPPLWDVTLMGCHPCEMSPPTALPPRAPMSPRMWVHSRWDVTLEQDVTPVEDVAPGQNVDVDGDVTPVGCPQMGTLSLAGLCCTLWGCHPGATTLRGDITPEGLIVLLHRAVTLCGGRHHSATPLHGEITPSPPLSMRTSPHCHHLHWGHRPRCCRHHPRGHRCRRCHHLHGDITPQCASTSTEP